MRIGRRLLDHGRTQQLALENASREDRRSACARLLDPLQHAVALGRRDQRADIRLLVGRIADP